MGVCRTFEQVHRLKSNSLGYIENSLEIMFKQVGTSLLLCIQVRVRQTEH